MFIGVYLSKFGWKERWRASRRDVAALAIIALFFVLFFPQAIFGGKFLIAGDAFFYSYPLRSVAWEIRGSGSENLYTVAGRKSRCHQS